MSKTFWAAFPPTALKLKQEEAVRASAKPTLPKWALKYLRSFYDVSFYDFQGVSHLDITVEGPMVGGKLHGSAIWTNTLNNKQLHAKYHHGHLVELSGNGEYMYRYVCYDEVCYNAYSAPLTRRIARDGTFHDVKDCCALNQIQRNQDCHRRMEEDRSHHAPEW